MRLSVSQEYMYLVLWQKRQESMLVSYSNERCPGWPLLKQREQREGEQERETESHVSFLKAQELEGLFPKDKIQVHPSNRCCWTMQRAQGLSRAQTTIWMKMKHKFHCSAEPYPWIRFCDWFGGQHTKVTLWTWALQSQGGKEESWVLVRQWILGLGQTP